MKYGINIDAYSGLAFKEAATIMKDNGFSTTFLNSHDPNFEDATEAAELLGIELEFLHAPYKNVNDIWLPTLKGEEYLNSLFRAVDICCEHKIKALTCHASSGNNPPNINDVGLMRFARLAEYAKSKGIRLAIENQRKLSNIAYLFEKFPQLTFCWDTGHEECFAGGLRFMPLFGKKLEMIHVHDNYMLPDGDEHMLPYDGKIDFERVAVTLAEYGHSGSVMLEVSNQNEKYRNMSPREFFGRAAEASRKLISAIENVK